MGWTVQPLLFFLARCTRNQLIRRIEFLKAENEMLRKRVPKQRIWLKPDERDRLVKLAIAVGPEVKHLVSDRHLRCDLPLAAASRRLYSTRSQTAE